MPVTGMNIADCDRGSQDIQVFIDKINKMKNNVLMESRETSAYWFGDDAETFRKNDLQILEQHFNSVIKEMSEAKKALDKDIRQQRAASKH